MIQPPFKRLVFWQNILSFHQSAFVRTLAENFGLEIWFAYEEDLPEDRKQMGWTIPDFGNAKVVDVREPSQWTQLVSFNDSETCHAFGSYFILPKAYEAFRVLRGKACGRVWITEAFNYLGWKGWVRTQRMRYHAWKEARKGFDLVFAMGKLGVEFFERAWIPARNLREFAYLVETVHLPPQIRQPNREHEFLYVGQLVRRKGVDILIRALRTVKGDWRLTIIGDGEEKGSLEALVRECGLETRVQFLGNCSNLLTRQKMNKADTLVLPSRWDGWGAVVNESLQMGTQVLVSDKCGAASFIQSSNQGRVFRSEDENDLMRTLSMRMVESLETDELREKLRNWSQAAISAEVVSKYFVESLRCSAEQPAPWRVQ